MNSSLGKKIGQITCVSGLVCVLEEHVTTLSVLLPWKVQYLDRNHLELYAFELPPLMWIAFHNAVSAPFQSTSPLPSWIQQAGSIVPRRPGTKHIQASNSFAELLSHICTVYILSLRNMTAEAKQVYNLQRFLNTTVLCSHMKKHTALNSLSWFFIGVLFGIQDGIFKVTKDTLLPSPSSLVSYIAHPKPSIISSLILWVCLTVE